MNPDRITERFMQGERTRRKINPETFDQEVTEGLIDLSKRLGLVTPARNATELFTAVQKMPLTPEQAVARENYGGLTDEEIWQVLEEDARLEKLESTLH